jgi:parallel beta-helix repeat protein
MQDEPLNRVLGLALFSAVLLLKSTSALSADWYVDGQFGTQNNPGTAASPFVFLWQAELVAKPGDTIHLKPSVTYSQLAIQVSGSAAAPITIEGDGVGPNLTKITGGGSNFGIWIDASYVVIRNFDVTAPGPWSAIYVNGGRHHVTIANNIAHDSGGSGISTYNADYIQVLQNIVYNNATVSSNGTWGSGISLYENKSIDNYVGIKMLIAGNTVYHNRNTPLCNNGACTDPDGSGIIVDDGRHTQSDNIPYTGHVRIAHNVSFGNGGRGIYVYSSDHVIIVRNTTYYNNQDTYEGSWRPGEIMADEASDIQIKRNITYTDGSTGEFAGINTGQHVDISLRLCNGSSGPVRAWQNLAYGPASSPGLLGHIENSTGNVSIDTDKWVDPQYNAPSLDPKKADFRPKRTSPAFSAAPAYGAFTAPAP